MWRGRKGATETAVGQLAARATNLWGLAFVSSHFFTCHTCLLSFTVSTVVSNVDDDILSCIPRTLCIVATACSWLRTVWAPNSSSPSISISFLLACSFPSDVMAINVWTKRSLKIRDEISLSSSHGSDDESVSKELTMTIWFYYLISI